MYIMLYHCCTGVEWSNRAHTRTHTRREELDFSSFLSDSPPQMFDGRYIHTYIHTWEVLVPRHTHTHTYIQVPKSWTVGMMRQSKSRRVIIILPIIIIITSRNPTKQASQIPCGGRRSAPRSTFYCSQESCVACFCHIIVIIIVDIIISGRDFYSTVLYWTCPGVQRVAPGWSPLLSLSLRFNYSSSPSLPRWRIIMTRGRRWLISLVPAQLFVIGCRSMRVTWWCKHHHHLIIYSGSIEQSLWI
jgi:hypothetical protein